MLARTTERLPGSDRSDIDTTSRPETGGVYSEDVFQYFLDIERRRTQISGQSFFLLVIRSMDTPGELIAPALAEKVFAALSASVRETDFIGWHLQGKMIGAVLIQASDPSKDAAGRVRARVSTALARRLPPGMVEQLRFRLCEIGSDREVWI